ncbi:MAG: MerR family transcriptional regulator [Bdellovibrionota bacterium]
MKDWLTIGKFAESTGVSPRALRLYETEGLIESVARGENGYRYYSRAQLEPMARIVQLKTLGFSLSEIKSLLQADQAMDTSKLARYLELRLVEIAARQRDLFDQKSKVESILSSMKRNESTLDKSERRYIMSQFENISVVVTGVARLEPTARHIARHLQTGDTKLEIVVWKEGATLPKVRPHVIVIEESMLGSKELSNLTPDVVVITGISAFSSVIEARYVSLYEAVGPHMTTVFNADDRVSVSLAANETIRKGKTFYFSKNSGLEDQIKRIGGIVSDGDTLKIFGFNQEALMHDVQLKEHLNFDEELAVLAAATAVLDVGLDPNSVKANL